MSKLLKILALLFAVALVAAACGNDDDDDGAAPAPAATEAPAPAATEAPAPAATEAPAPSPADGCAWATDGDVRGVDKENGVITIGTSQPFCGRAAVAGEGLLAGIQMTVDEVNAAGGIDGCTFELAWEDDRFEIEQMVTNVRN